jgi:hypothetical protein
VERGERGGGSVNKKGRDAARLLLSRGCRLSPA